MVTFALIYLNHKLSIDVATWFELILLLSLNLFASPDSLQYYYILTYINLFPYLNWILSDVVFLVMVNCHNFDILLKWKFKWSKLSFMLNFNHTAPNCNLENSIGTSRWYFETVQQFMSSSRSSDQWTLSSYPFRYNNNYIALFSLI